MAEKFTDDWSVQSAQYARNRAADAEQWLKRSDWLLALIDYGKAKGLL